jgi:hypothetical protein
MSGCGSTGRTGSAGAAGSSATSGGAASSGTAGSGTSRSGAASSGASGGGASGATGLPGDAGSWDGGASSGVGGSSGGAAGGMPLYPLEMNDVTIMAPLPASLNTPVLLRADDLADDGTALVPPALIDRLLSAGSFGESIATLAPVYEDLHLVAVRFDLCDRSLAGACPDTEDARMRLVFQPLLDPPSAQDVGFHAFYTIRNEEIADAVAVLQKLAMTAPPQTGALRVSPALSAADPEPYAAQVRAFVRRYGGEARLLRLTTNAQNLNSAAVAWNLRGLEKKGSTFAEMTIAGTTDSSERVTLSGTASYDTVPIADTPSGLPVALSEALFDRADAPSKSASLAVLAAVDNPLSMTTQTVACVGCHVSTVVMSARASAALDPLTLPGRYTSKYDLSTAGGKSAETPRTLRALGYFGKLPMISQRVVNETAQVLTEIEQRFPR